jgi:hypothetical protein
LNQAVHLHDIADVEAFVRNTLHTRLRAIPRDDHDEMMSEGLVIIFDLGRRYDPSKDTGSRKLDHVCRTARCCVPSFAGWATYLLHRKMLDAWHRLHPEHVLRTQPDGSRKYEYLQRPASIDERDDVGIAASVIDLNGTRHFGDFIRT